MLLTAIAPTVVQFQYSQWNSYCFPEVNACSTPINIFIFCLATRYHECIGEILKKGEKKKEKKEEKRGIVLLELGAAGLACWPWRLGISSVPSPARRRRSRYSARQGDARLAAASDTPISIARMFNVVHPGCTISHWFSKPRKGLFPSYFPVPFDSRIGTHHSLHGVVLWQSVVEEKRQTKTSLMSNFPPQWSVDYLPTNFCMKQAEEITFG